MNYISATGKTKLNLRMRKLCSNKHNNAFKKKGIMNYTQEIISFNLEYIQVNTKSDNGRNDTDYKD